MSKPTYPVKWTIRAEGHPEHIKRATLAIMRKPGEEIAIPDKYARRIELLFAEMIQDALKEVRPELRDSEATDAQ